MGMFDFDPSYDPTNPNDQTQEYKKPGSDPFAEFGIMAPLQRQMQAYQFQNQIQQQQLARQQQMLGMQATMQNMGVNAAQVGSGLSGPMLGMMGGLQPSFVPKLTNAINAFLPGGGLSGSPAQQGPQGMTPPGPNVLSGMSEDQILTNALSANAGNKVAAYRQAAQAFISRGDPNSQMIAGRLLDKADDLERQGTKDQSVIDKNKADTARAQAETKEKLAALSNPSSLEHISYPNGDTGVGYMSKNPDGSFAGFKTVPEFRGRNVAYTSAETPSQSGQDLQNFRDKVQNSVDAIDSMHTILGNLKDGAAQGWTAEAVEKVNQVVGTIKQLVPGSQLDESATKELNDHKKDFQAWASKTGINDSVWADLTMQLAKSYAGGRVSNQDIKRAAEALGESSSNPGTVAAVLGNVEQRTVKSVDSQHDLLSSNPSLPAQDKAALDQVHQYFHKRVDQYSNPPQQKTVVRTGMHDGKKVVQYSDGSLDYAN